MKWCLRLPWISPEKDTAQAEYRAYVWKRKWSSEFRAIKAACILGVGYQKGGSCRGKKKFCEENSLNPLGNFYAVYIEWDYKTFGGEELLGGWPVNRDFIGYTVIGYVGAHTHLEMRELSEYSGLSVETSEMS